MGKYSDSPDWHDVVPIPQDDGGPYALAAIAYTDDYSEATSYLRAVMAANEMSERVLRLTEDIIDMNPAHYTVWLYRAKVIFALKKPIPEELQWLNDVSLQNLKNYQIWHHRQLLVESLPCASEDQPSPNAASLLEAEEAFLQLMLSRDAKNYHVWTYRQWLIEHFNIYDSSAEMEAVEELIDEDVRNNSAWCHRWLLVFGRYDSNTGKGPMKSKRGKERKVPEDTVKHEIAYTKGQIDLAPQNASSWSYLRGILRRAGRPLSSELNFVVKYADPADPDNISSSWALDFYAEACAEENWEPEQAKAAWELLGERFDPIRKNYWQYRIGLLESEESA